jgi:hypothetical protein
LAGASRIVSDTGKKKKIRKEKGLTLVGCEKIDRQGVFGQVPIAA